MTDRKLKAATARELCGGVSDMTFWRWSRDPAMDFPKPIYIGGRRYWSEAELAAWLEAQPRARTAA